MEKTKRELLMQEALDIMVNFFYPSKPFPYERLDDKKFYYLSKKTADEFKKAYSKIN